MFSTKILNSEGRLEKLKCVPLNDLMRVANITAYLVFCLGNDCTRGCKGHRLQICSNYFRKKDAGPIVYCMQIMSKPNGSFRDEFCVTHHGVSVLENLLTDRLTVDIDSYFKFQQPGTNLIHDVAIVANIPITVYKEYPDYGHLYVSMSDLRLLNINTAHLQTCGTLYDLVLKQCVANANVIRLTPWIRDIRTVYLVDLNQVYRLDPPHPNVRFLRQTFNPLNSLQQLCAEALPPDYISHTGRLPQPLVQYINSCLRRSPTPTSFRSNNVHNVIKNESH